MNVYVQKSSKSGCRHIFFFFGLLCLLQVHIQTTIDQQLGTRHKTAQLLTSQKHGRTCHVLGQTQPAQRRAALDVCPLGRVRQVDVVELCADRAGQQRVAADAVLSQSNGARLHQTLDTGLGGRVVCLLAATHERRDRTDADNGAAGGRLVGHLPASGLHSIKGTRQVRGNGVLKQLRRQIQKLGKLAHAGVAHKHIESPLAVAIFGRKGRHNVLDKLAAGLGLGNVAGKRDDMALDGIARGDQGLGLFQKALEVGLVADAAQMVDADLGAVADVVEGDGLGC